MAMSIYDYSAKTLDGQDVSLADYRGQVLLIVNTASKCGFTPQYEGLEALYKAHKDRGFTVLAFPCNQFGAQEPGNAEEIANFCSLTYDVSFPVMSKIDVNGADAHPLYKFLKKEQKGVLGTEAIKWNFTKFLIGKDGQVVDRFAPTVKPEDLKVAVEALL
ncbi:glutathione peroxidase [Caulobacter vibrioides]|uniref:Glutathione peroxidase n=2 Tax=Caulobacter vibrioides TaxID=155892 RepID=Q9A7J3_CAUVC|nr:glutathione peroxidase [Caulobacter vibrioides]YP_002517177.1 glutathione peroxidase [Caulobacter vibrioides NA1000]AAK23706.1 glutathione peroxidase [Caulobacter vibrioides CB15]ACL95269.1 glutathione peroxidase [Caulobacter vibrioides NA1000]ATC28608.1 glutathione peroxidase [Caulobacter vibrioides]QXZ53789.1 glutathione peroxidase [Caulobacter vibrioides]